MNNKKEDILLEFRDSIGEDISSREFEALLHELDILQEASLPRKEFESELLDRLINLHSLEREKTTHSYSFLFFLKIFGGITTLFMGMFFLFQSLYTPVQNNSQDSLFQKSQQRIEVGEYEENKEYFQKSVSFPEQDVSDEATSEDIAPMMMQSSLREENTLGEQSIQDICESHSGVFLRSQQSCDFGSGNTCSALSLLPQSDNPCEFIEFFHEE